jgi:hypothetical protein
MFSKLYKQLVPRVGINAANAAVRDQYAGLALVTIGVVGFAIESTLRHPWIFVDFCLAAVAITCGIMVYAKIQFARAASEYLGVKVRWFEYPNYQMKYFDIWLQRVKKRPQKS